MSIQCPNCGETRVSWKKELWGSGKAQFWDAKKEVVFICGGKYIYDEKTDTYEQKNRCRRNNNVS